MSPADDVAFYAKFFDVKAEPFCTDSAGKPTPAVRTDRGYLLFTTVTEKPNEALNVYLEHVGWSNQDPTTELRRQMMLGITVWPPGDVRQCEDVAMGQACGSGAAIPNNFYFIKAPNGARLEVSRTPGPSTSGFAHMHLNGEFPAFFNTVLGPALQTTAGTTHIDGVNLTNVGREMFLPMDPVDSRGKPIDHLGFSTGDLQATYDRIKQGGIMIQEEIAMRPEYGFRSFFVKSPQGVWVEIVEDSAFAP